MDTAGPDSVTLAIVGAVVTIVTSFIPLSPILGGAVSGSLHGGDGNGGARIGAYAGVVVSLPFALLGLSLLGGIVAAAADLCRLLFAHTADYVSTEDKIAWCQME